MDEKEIYIEMCYSLQGCVLVVGCTPHGHHSLFMVNERFMGNHPKKNGLAFDGVPGVIEDRDNCQRFSNWCPGTIFHFPGYLAVGCTDVTKGGHYAGEK